MACDCSGTDGCKSCGTGTTSCGGLHWGWYIGIALIIIAMIVFAFWMYKKNQDKQKNIRLNNSSNMEMNNM